jgi:hypothetical protein
VPDFTTNSVATALTERTGLTFDRVKIGLALMHTGRAQPRRNRMSALKARVRSPGCTHTSRSFWPR